MENTILAAVLTMGGLGIVFSSGLALAYNKLKVEENPLVDLVAEELPASNCGGCGKPGCRKFAEDLVNGTIAPEKCVVMSDDAMEAIGQLLGITISGVEKKIARVMCQGGLNEAKYKGVYFGAKSCMASEFASGGTKLCDYGCIGFGDCARACPFDAIKMNDNELPIVDEKKCTGCEKCVAACPKNIIEMHSRDTELLMLCKNRDINKDAKKACSVSCTACGLCTHEEIPRVVVNDNLATIDYNRVTKQNELPYCPRNCFNYFGKEETIVIKQEKKEASHA